MKEHKLLMLDKSEWLNQCDKHKLYVSGNHGTNSNGATKAYWNKNAGEGYILK